MKFSRRDFLKSSAALAATGFLLDRPTSHTIILGAKSLSEYVSAIAATDLPALTPTESRRIGELREKLVR